MTTKFSILILVFSALLLVASSCKKDQVVKENPGKTPTETPVDPNAEPEGDGVIANAVVDIDGNAYNAVKLGNQVWMKENLRTTKYADGTAIPLGYSCSVEEAYRYRPNNSTSYVHSYGYLYNWMALTRGEAPSDVNPNEMQGVCPDGWHVPSALEWNQLINYLRSQPQYRCDNCMDCIAKALSATSGWDANSNACAVGNNLQTNNATHFSALPAGDFTGSYYGFGRYANFWTSTNAYYKSMSFNGPGVSETYGFLSDSYSVRCVRDRQVEE